MIKLFETIGSFIFFIYIYFFSHQILDLNKALLNRLEWDNIVLKKYVGTNLAIVSELLQHISETATKGIELGAWFIVFWNEKGCFMHHNKELIHMLQSKISLSICPDNKGWTKLKMGFTFLTMPPRLDNPYSGNGISARSSLKGTRLDSGTPSELPCPSSMRVWMVGSCFVGLMNVVTVSLRNIK